jgi:L-methionine (R)-S-oxide reductase
VPVSRLRRASRIPRKNTTAWVHTARELPQNRYAETCASTDPGDLMNDHVSKICVYEKLRSELPNLIGNQTDFLANISNFAALLFNTLPSLNWAGFYLLRGTDLVLGPFQGKPACSCIAMGDGVCGTAALQRAAVVVPDVHAFPGHIVCDEASQSEMVLPVFKDGHLVGVLDLDSPLSGRFDETDRDSIQQLLQTLMDGTVVPEFRLAPAG